MAKPIRTTGLRAGTAERLIVAAERLFATRGIDGVSLRQVNAAAGQRNLSAAHYHFGSKAALIAAIYDYRMESVNQRRAALLDAIGSTGREHDLAALTEAIITPILDEDTAGGGHYVRFMAQVMGHPQLNLAGLWQSRHGQSLARIMADLREALPGIPAAVLGQRFGLMWEQVVHALADRERLCSEAGGISEGLFVSNLVDVVAAGLGAPVSAVTHSRLPRRAAAGGT